MGLRSRNSEAPLRRDLPLPQKRVELLAEQTRKHGGHQFVEMGARFMRVEPDRPGPVSRDDEEQEYRVRRGLSERELRGLVAVCA